MLNQVEQVIKTVLRKLPSDFPDYISRAIFDGMRQAKQMLES